MRLFMNCKFMFEIKEVVKNAEIVRIRADKKHSSRYAARKEFIVQHHTINMYADVLTSSRQTTEIIEFKLTNS